MSRPLLTFLLPSIACVCNTDCLVVQHYNLEPNDDPQMGVSVCTSTIPFHADVAHQTLSLSRLHNV